MKYFLSNYGQCKLEKCMCIDQHEPRFKGAWAGLACPDWEPKGARNILDLIEQAKKVTNERKD